MVNVVTLAEAKKHLRVVDDSQDDEISRKIGAAQKAIEHFLNQEIPTNGDSPVTYPDDIKEACLLMVGGLFEIREDQIVGASIVSNPAAVNLLYPYRVEIGI